MQIVEESGKLECMAVVVRVGPHATIQCQVESPASREGIPLWMFESGLDILPLADGALAEFGQKVIRVRFATSHSPITHNNGLKCCLMPPEADFL
jgi:hypothetical protein